MRAIEQESVIDHLRDEELLLRLLLYSATRTLTAAPYSRGQFLHVSAKENRLPGIRVSGPLIERQRSGELRTIRHALQ